VKLLLVDGHYYVYRSFFAIRDLTNSRGEPVNAIYGFVKTLRRMVKDVQPQLGAVLWDMGLPERRLALQPEYKQQREEMPDAMKPQLTFIQRLVPMLGFASLGTPGAEADDLIAAYTVAARARGDEVVLATNDKDLFQLVGDGVRVYSTNKTDLATPADTFALLGPDAVREKWGVEPAQIADVLCLVGDASDNIPGVTGIGPKTASALIREHGSVGALMNNPDAIANEKVREKIKASLALIAQNREMVHLDDHLPLPAPLDALGIQPRHDELIAALETCEFKSLLAEVKAEAAKSAAPITPQQGELFG
jgi:DNA polymerase-1